MSAAIRGARFGRAHRPSWQALARWVGLGTLVFIAPVAAAQNPPALDIDVAMDLAEAHSQALPAQQWAAMAARERAVAAGQIPDPTLRWSLDNVPIEGSAQRLLTREPMTARSVGISQAWPDEAKRRARSQRHEQDALLAWARRDARRAELRRETALAWLAVRAELQRTALLAAMQTEAALTVQAAEAAYRAGRGSQVDVFTARALPVRLDDQRLQVDTALANARSALRRWIGAAADRPLGKALPLRADPVSDPDGARLLAADPELGAAIARENSARAMADLAREERRADWSTDLRFQHRGSRFDNMVSIGVSLPLRWDPANRQQRELAARLAETAQVEAETEELRRARRAEVERWQQRWRAGLDRLAAYDQLQLPLAASRIESSLSAYRAGNGPLLAVLAARQAELALRMERVQIELDSASDEARLSTLIPPPEATR
ncbi:MAG: TolC family protein [Rubrivivax sp.]|nr:TolC family protein [Rubrivivax sp.]